MKLKHFLWVLWVPLFLSAVPLADTGLKQAKGLHHDAGLMANNNPKAEISKAGNVKSGYCLVEDLHPLQVSVRLVDPMQPGAWMRAQVDIQSAIDLDNVQIEFTTTSAVVLAGPHKASLQHLAAEEQVVQTLTLKVPNKRDQQQVSILVHGMYQGNEIRRGATLNLLPQGPHHPGVLSAVPSASGDPVIEYPGAARRIR